MKLRADEVEFGAFRALVEGTLEKLAEAENGNLKIGARKKAFTDLRRSLTALKASLAGVKVHVHKVEQGLVRTSRVGTPEASTEVGATNA
jgi:hypothetical protein